MVKINYRIRFSIYLILFLIVGFIAFKLFNNPTLDQDKVSNLFYLILLLFISNFSFYGPTIKNRDSFFIWKVHWMPLNSPSPPQILI